jgi:SAM-dependent methyltransferase
MNDVHPLARSLLEASVITVTPRNVVVFGAGSGRNIAPLLSAGWYVDVLEEAPERAREVASRFGAEARLRVVLGSYVEPIAGASAYDAGLSTHALLHGSRERVVAALGAAARALRPGAPFFFTLGSTADPRFGKGRRIDAQTWAAETGSEAGVPHVYFDEDGVRSLLGEFELLSLERHAGADSVGRWAHTDDEAERILHWFVRARTRPASA